MFSVMLVCQLFFPQGDFYVTITLGALDLTIHEPIPLLPAPAWYHPEQGFPTPDILKPVQYNVRTVSM